jgi:hypothetical protein
MRRHVFTFGAGAPKITKVSSEEQKELEPGETSEIVASLVPVKDEQAAAAVPLVGTIKVPKTPRKTQVKKVAPIEPKVYKPTGDFSKFGALEKYAIQNDMNESKNPYKNPDEKVFPLQTRLSFQTKINEMYVSSDFAVKGAVKTPDYDACKKQSVDNQSKIEMYEYQKFVMEYMRNATPYRGLLVYHGLGSGKTCSAISAAEALFSVSKKKIIVMTPFSLRDNFIREVMFCGFRHFRTENHWVLLDSSDEVVRIFAKEILGLTDEYISKNKEIWVPEFETEGSSEPPASNFKEKTPVQKEQITKQLSAQISSRIQFINYNGISASRLKRIACKIPETDGTLINFDDSIIIIDEIHNLTRLMQGTIEPYLTSLPMYHTRRKVPVEAVTPATWKPALCNQNKNYKRGYLLYRLLTGASNSKIIGLSGTPLINFPEEIAILMNLLGGYIHTVTMQMTPASEGHKNIINEFLKAHAYVDFIEIKSVSNYLQVLFTLLPEGMKKVADGVERVEADTPTPNIFDISKEFIETMSKQGFSLIKDSVKYDSQPILPPVGEEFEKYFLDPVDETKIINHIVLRKRIQGLISYYKGNKKELMPLVTKDELVKVPFSQYSMAEYCNVRGEELKIQMERSKLSGGPLLEGKTSSLWAELHDLVSSKGSNSYRMSSRQTGNFAFPADIVRPRPGSLSDVLNVELHSKEESKEIYAEGAIEGGEEDEAAAEEAAEEDERVDEEEEKDALAELVSKGDVEAASKFEELTKVPLLLETAARPAASAPVSGASAAMAAKAIRKGECATGVFEDTIFFTNEDRETSEVKVKLLTTKAAEVASMRSIKFRLVELKGVLQVVITGTNDLNRTTTKDSVKEVFPNSVFKMKTYAQATAETKRCLRDFADKRLRLYARTSDSSIIKDFKAGVPTNAEGLEKYSPKYAEILKRILESPGSNLVYSQFLEMEGIGIFQEVLKINEFESIEISEDGRTFTPETVQRLTTKVEGFDIKEVKRFLSFTGADKRAKRSSALRVFNARYKAEAEPGSKFYELSGEMSTVLENAGFTGNLKGELCSVFCITSAGSEGLSLRNVRRVHIMEPYWNHVRTDQVKGRAVRICSHIDLDYNPDESLNQRTVEVYTYCSVFSPDVLRNPGDSIPETVRIGDGKTPQEASKLEIEIPHGVKQYIMTSDEHLYSLSQRKKKVLTSIQNLMKRSAVDCLVNQSENDEEGVECITLDGTPSQYAFHPILSSDIAITTSEFKGLEEKQELVDAVVNLAENEAEVEREEKGITAARVEVPKVTFAPREFEAVEIKSKKRGTFLAVPVFEKGSTIPVKYNLHKTGKLPTPDNRIGSSSVVQEGDNIGLPNKPFVFSE